MPTKAELEQQVEALKAAHAAEYGIDALNEQDKPADDPWELLSRKFDAGTIKKNPRGYHYVSIDAVYNRLDEVLGPNWTLAVQSTMCHPVDPAWKQYGTRSPKAAFLAVVTVRISALIANNIHTVRDGVGADFADDPDKAVKTALANAVKKAANGFGVGRYLWNEEERAAIDEENEARNDTRALKLEVKALAEKQLGYSLDGPPSEVLDVLAALFEVDKSDLASAETLNKILEANA